MANHGTWQKHYNNQIKTIIHVVGFMIHNCLCIQGRESHHGTLIFQYFFSRRTLQQLFIHCKVHLKINHACHFQTGTYSSGIQYNFVRRIFIVPIRAMCVIGHDYKDQTVGYIFYNNTNELKNQQILPLNHFKRLLLCY